MKTSMPMGTCGNSKPYVIMGKFHLSNKAVEDLDEIWLYTFLKL